MFFGEYMYSIKKGAISLYWKISDFVDQVKQALGEDKLHSNTVDGWFKKLEDDRIHFVTRTEETNEKVYDNLDLRLAVHIKKKRNEKWSLSAIFNEIKDEFELRPFPAESQGSTSAPQVIDLENLKSRLIDELRGSFEEVAASQLIEIKQHYESLLKQLPRPKTLEEEKEERFQEMIARRRVESQLEEEALNMWSTKPEEERFKKLGWFRKEEDFAAREFFVKGYVNERFADRLRAELGLR
jgi:hypothetical protein